MFYTRNPKSPSHTHPPARSVRSLPKLSSSCFKYFLSHACLFYFCVQNAMEAFVCKHLDVTVAHCGAWRAWAFYAAQKHDDFTDAVGLHRINELSNQNKPYTVFINFITTISFLILLLFLFSSHFQFHMQGGRERSYKYKKFSMQPKIILLMEYTE